MKIFLSWSGEASQQVAELLRQFLPCMIQELKLFMSRHDLSSGGRWSHELSRELETSNFGIVCLTPENLHSPWILFEAGALTKHVEGRACCLLLRGLRPPDVSGPLSQFQNATFTRLEIRKLIFDLNRLTETPLDEASLGLIFDKWWPDLDAAVRTALTRTQPPNPIEPRRETADLLEELLLRVRSIERALEPMPRNQYKVEYSEEDIAAFIEAMLKTLAPSQVDLLRQLVVPGGARRIFPPDSILKRHEASDLDGLLKIGLLVQTEDGISLPHDAIAHHIRDILWANGAVPRITPASTGRPASPSAR